MVSNQAAPVAGTVKLSLLKVLLVTGALSLFVALGMWQLNRAQEKEMIRDRVLAFIAGRGWPGDAAFSYLLVLAN